MAPLCAQTPTGNPTEAVFNTQPYNRPESCLPCHQRQYDELHSSVKSGYRNVSPLFNGLEMSGNLISGGLLRPVYSDSSIVLPDGVPLNSNMFTTTPLAETRQVQAGFCFTCHNADVLKNADKDLSKREVPQLAGLQANFRPDLIRPLRDYAMVDASGKQVLPASIGGDAPVGAQPSLGAAGITCDVCHNVTGPDLKRSFQQDGFANNSVTMGQSIEKIGPFAFPVAVKGDFHVATSDPAKIAFLRSGAFCNACHDVRVPNNNLTALEKNSNAGTNVPYYRLENLSTEWQIGPYNSTNNPFGKVIRCQDCHMSQFPFAGNSTYKVGDLNITSPTPSIFASDYAAVPGVSTENNYPLQKRQVVSHYFTGVDVPLLTLNELRSRLGPGYPDVFQPGTDTHGVPYSLETRREDLLKAAARVDASKTDATAAIGGTMTVRIEAVALTGHRFPAGFSQERTGYMKLNVTDDNGFLLYQSGYVTDKPHPNTGENAPDGNLDDEDIEHVHAIVDPGIHTATYTPGLGTNGGRNLVFDIGPDDGPDGRLYSGIQEGLVLFRNELTRIFLPGDALGRNDANGNPVIVQKPHFEETFNASLANSVDNYRSLSPLAPTMFNYEITLPTQEELNELGVQLKFPLHVHAEVLYEHFPPLFLRYIAQTTGPQGPTGHDLNLMNENRIDALLKNIPSLASSDTTVGAK
jgi:hypothetical protein